MGGKFDMQIYQAYISQQGMTPTAFENEQRDLMLSTRLENLEQQSLVVSDADARAEYQRKNLKVGLQYIAIDKNQFRLKVNTDPALVKAYFDKNQANVPHSRKRELRSDCRKQRGFHAERASLRNAATTRLRRSNR